MWSNRALVLDKFHCLVLLFYQPFLKPWWKQLLSNVRKFIWLFCIWLKKKYLKLLTWINRTEGKVHSSIRSFHTYLHKPLMDLSPLGSTNSSKSLYIYSFILFMPYLYVIVILVSVFTTSNLARFDLSLVAYNKKLHWHLDKILTLWRRYAGHFRWLWKQKNAE